MQFIIMLIMLIGAGIASHYLAMEKGQNKMIWPMATVLLGPGLFIVQYLVAVYNQKRKMA